MFLPCFSFWGPWYVTTNLCPSWRLDARVASENSSAIIFYVEHKANRRVVGPSTEKGHAARQCRHGWQRQESEAVSSLAVNVNGHGAKFGGKAAIIFTCEAGLALETKYLKKIKKPKDKAACWYCRWCSSKHFLPRTKICSFMSMDYEHVIIDYYVLSQLLHYYELCRSSSNVSVKKSLNKTNLSSKNGSSAPDIEPSSQRR